MLPTLILGVALASAAPPEATVAPTPTSIPEVLAAYRARAAKVGPGADAQVRLALWCEAHDLEAERIKHLALAVLIEPGHATARGLLGLLNYQGKWRPPQRVAEQFRADGALAAALAEYNKKRQNLPATVEAHWKLALWCEQNQLEAEATAHLTTVTRLDRSHEMAWKHLGYRKFNGRWATPEQIKGEIEEAATQRKAHLHWTRRLSALRRMLAQRGRRAEAERSLLDITDPRAAGAVWTVFAQGSEASQKVAVDLFRQIDSPEATLDLGALAVYSNSPDIRRLAAESLVPRDPRDVVGNLIDLVRTELKYEVRSVDGPGQPGSLYVEGEQFNIQRIYNAPLPPSVDTRSSEPGTAILARSTPRLIVRVGLPGANSSHSASEKPEKSSREEVTRVLERVMPSSHAPADSGSANHSGGSDGGSTFTPYHQPGQVFRPNYGPGLTPGSIRPNYGPGLTPGSIQPNYGPGLTPGSIPSNFGPGLTPGSIPSNFGPGREPRMGGNSDFGTRMIPPAVGAQPYADEPDRPPLFFTNPMAPAPRDRSEDDGSRPQDETRRRELNRAATIARNWEEARRAAVSAEQRLQVDLAAVRAYNEDVKASNMYVLPVLKTVTAKDLGPDHEAWTKWWTDSQGYAYNTPPGPKPTFVEDVPPAYLPRFGRVSNSCFGAGTPVQTIDGTRPIESIKVGDRVLTQSTKDGALGVQPVVAVYHNPPARTFKIDLGGDTVVATGIHRFWRAGKGWVMARDLKPGDMIRTLGGTVHVSAVTANTVQPVFNLEVDGGHSFFVGDRAALVHDNSLVQPLDQPFDADREAAATRPGRAG